MQNRRHKESSDSGGAAPARDMEAAARLLDRPDGDTLDPFVVRWDKRRIYADGGRAAVGFGFIHRVGLATGDPIGDPEAFDESIHNFVRYCQQMGRRPAVLGAAEATSEIYQRHGLQSMYVGDEAILDTGKFTLEGRRKRNARQSVSRTRRAEITTEFYREGDIDDELREQLLAVAGDERERSFAMGLSGLLSGAYPDCLIAVARDRSGLPVAFQRYVACRRGAALSLDTMRRAPQATNGINERLIVDTVEWGRARGVTEVSLNFAAFRGVFDGSTAVTRAGAARTWLLRRMEGRFNIQMDSLRRFDAKFAPRWVPRYLVYRSAWDLPMIGLAALSAEGLLPFAGGADVTGGRRRLMTSSHRGSASGSGDASGRG
jgi:lysyl-tRNA synthetase class 2